MKTLNLVDIDKSDIKYQIQKFPDGQQNIVILDKNPNKTGYKTENYIVGTNKSYLILDHVVDVQIKSRLNNWLDLELIVCAVASLRELGVEKIHLYAPYIMGARSDRKFEIGGNRYIKDVIAPVLNSLNFESVTCIDPHSYVLENCIDNFESENNVKLVQFALKDLKAFTLNGKIQKYEINNHILVSPDDGASKKIYKLAEQIGYKGDIITCSKDRDKDGKLSKINVPHSQIHDNADKDIVIIDDICDGGATFINIAKFIKENYGSLFNGKIYLIVTHGIFSKGFDELSKYFDGIYCTNSYEEFNLHPKTFVKQLNVF